jgi:hypothetical protein
VWVAAEALARRAHRVVATAESPPRTHARRAFRRTIRGSSDVADRIGHGVDHLWELAALLVPVAYVVVFAWPSSVDLAGWVWGSHGDALSNAYLFTWIVQSTREHAPVTFDRAIAIPFGDNMGALPHEPLFYWLQVHLSLLIGAVASLNLITFAALPAASWAMYRLALRLTASASGSFFAGVAFGCSSFILTNTRGEPTLVQIWIFPVVALALLHVLARPGPWSTLMAAGAVVVGATLNFYYSLFIALMCVAIVLTWVAATSVFQRRLPVTSIIAAGLGGLLGAAFAGLLYVHGTGDFRQTAAGIVRPEIQLALLAPEPIDLLLPSRFNPWFGTLSQHHFLERSHRLGVPIDLSQICVSVAAVALAALGLAVLVAKARWLKTDKLARHRVELLSILGVGALGLWLMVPPTAFPRRRLRLISLQWDIHSIVPAYQVFFRAVVLFEVAVATLAAIALAWLALRKPKLAAGLSIVLATSVLIEGYVQERDPALHVVSTPAYTWLVEHPGKYAIAEYPMVPPASAGNEYTYAFNQRFHHHPMVNGILGGTRAASMQEEMRDPNLPGVAERLAALGVRYVLWHPDVLESFRRLLPDVAAQYAQHVPTSPNYILQASFTDGSKVFAVEPSGVRVFAFYAAGFGTVQPGPNATVGRWLDGFSGEIDVFRRGPPAPAQLQFSCMGLAQPAAVKFEQGQNTAATASIVPGRMSPVVVPVVADDGMSRLQLRVSPYQSMTLTDPRSIFCTFISAR